MRGTAAVQTRLPTQITNSRCRFCSSTCLLRQSDALKSSVN